MSYSILTTKYVKIADTNHQIKLVAANNIQNSTEVKVFGLILNVRKSVNCYRLGLALGLINPYSMCIWLSLNKVGQNMVGQNTVFGKKGLF